MIWVKAGHKSRSKRGMFTKTSHIDTVHFYPNLAKVGKDIIEGEATLGCEDALAGMTA